MEMSKKDRLIILAMAIIATIINLLIAYDPLDILVDFSQKMIIAVIVAIAVTLLLIYQVQRIKKR